MSYLTIKETNNLLRRETSSSEYYIASRRRHNLLFDDDVDMETNQKTENTKVVFNYAPNSNNNNKSHVITIVVNGVQKDENSVQRFVVKRSTLTNSCSPVLSAMLENKSYIENQTNEINMPQFNEFEMDAFLKMLHVWDVKQTTGIEIEMVLTHQLVLNCIPIAIYLQCDGLVEELVEFVKSSFRPCELIAAFDKAEGHVAHRIWDKVVYYNAFAQIRAYATYFEPTSPICAKPSDGYSLRALVQNRRAIQDAKNNKTSKGQFTEYSYMENFTAHTWLNILEATQMELDL